MYVTPMLLLYEFAEEPAIRQLAGMMLDLLLADYLTESLDGAYCGGHSRVIDVGGGATTENRVVRPPLPLRGRHRPSRRHRRPGRSSPRSRATGPRASSTAIANRRDDALRAHGAKARPQRDPLRPALNPPVHKYDYMTPGYGLGSLQGGILQPIQQHTWDVTWLGSAENSTLFTVHPSVSARELAMFFPEEIHGLTRTITAQKGSYASPDKLVSASAFEKVFQHENVLLALYQVPPGETLRARGPLRRPTASRGPRRRAGCSAGTAPSTSRVFPCRRRDVEGRPTASAAIAARPTGTGSSSSRRAARWRRRRSTRSASACWPRRRPAWTGRGRTSRFGGATPTDARTRGRGASPHGRIDGAPAPFPAEWLYRGPFLESRVGSGRIALTDGADRPHARLQRLHGHRVPMTTLDDLLRRLRRIYVPAGAPVVCTTVAEEVRERIAHEAEIRTGPRPSRPAARSLTITVREAASRSAKGKPRVRFQVEAGERAMLSASHARHLYAFARWLARHPGRRARRALGTTRARSQPAFTCQRPVFDLYFTQSGRTIRHLDPEAYVRQMAEHGFTHLEVNGLAFPEGMEEGVPGEVYPRFYTYCPALDQFVDSFLNRGIYPKAYLRANLAAPEAERVAGRALRPRPHAHVLRAALRARRAARAVSGAPRLPRRSPFRSFKPRFNLAVSHPVVRRHYRELMQNLLREVPALGSLSVWTNDSGAGFEFTRSLYVGPNGSAYLVREWSEEDMFTRAAAENVVSLPAPAAGEPPPRSGRGSG